MPILNVVKRNFTTGRETNTMSSTKVPDDPRDMEFDVEIPSKKMTERFDQWNDIYTVEKLSQMTLSGIESEKLEFENKVMHLKQPYNRGEALNPAMAKVMGAKPYTDQQLEEARRTIEREADKIRPRFKRAKGIKEEKRRESLHGFINNLIDKAQITIFKLK